MPYPSSGRRRLIWILGVDSESRDLQRSERWAQRHTPDLRCFAVTDSLKVVTMRPIGQH